MRKCPVILLLLVITSWAGAQVNKDYPMDLAPKDRIMGAIMGVLIGDALGVGCHWYYDLAILKDDFGPWISGYVDPKTDSKNSFVAVARKRFQEGVRAGDVSQTGQIFVLLLESVAEQGTYDRGDFASRVDAFFKTIDGTNYSGRYTDSAMRETWKNRHAGIGWDDLKVGSSAITSEAAQMGVLLAALFYKKAEDVAEQVYRNTTLFYRNDFAIGQTAAYALAIAGFINGVPLKDIKSYPRSIPAEIRSRVAPYADTLTQIETGAAVAWDPAITFDPPRLIAQVYGAHCEIQQLLPAAYYLIHRYPDDFETAVLTAVNSGGNNMARAALTGGMSGAMNGLSGIPKRLIDGLKDHQRLLRLAEKVAAIQSRRP